MKFFVPRPLAATSKQSNDAHECMRNFSSKSAGVNTTDRKIYQIEFVRDGERYDACVGDADHDSGEIVVAILEAPHKYLICTPNNGGYSGKPIHIRKRNVTTVVEFES